MRHVCPKCHEQIDHLDAEVEATGAATFYLPEDASDEGELEMIGIDWCDIDVVDYSCPKCHSSIKPDLCQDPDDPDVAKAPCRHEFRGLIEYVGGAKMTRCATCHQDLRFEDGDLVIVLLEKAAVA